MNIPGIIALLLIGFYLFFGAYKNYDWFFTAPDMRRSADRIGREKTRKLYMFVGIVCMIVAIVFVFV